MEASMSFSFIDLFAGIGGFRIALEKLGGTCVFSCEIEEGARRVYYDNFGELPFKDVREIDERKLPDFDILCAGFPCQPFSISGLKKGFSDRKNGDLYFHILRIVNAKKPKVVFLENVKHFARHNGGETLKTAIKLLEEAGYVVFYKTLNSKFFGLAQSRERLFMVAFRKDCEAGKYFSFPLPSKYPIVVVEDILDSNPPEHLFYRGDDVKIIKPDILCKVHTPYQIAYVRKGRQGERIYSVKGTSITISHSTGGTFPKTGGYWTKEGIRRLSVAECKRLFGFPENFNLFAVSESKAIALLGNSVPINTVEAIGRKILEALKGSKTKILLETA